MPSKKRRIPMTIHAKTLRHYPPLTRELVRDISIIEHRLRRIKSRLEFYTQIERENNAWNKRQEHFKTNGKIDPISLDWPEQSMLSKISKERI